MTKLLYQGHGSFRIESDAGLIIYVDPFAGGGYDALADYVLITHEHYDHNAVEKVPLKDGTVIIRAKDSIVDGEYRTFVFPEMSVEAVEAYNEKHNKEECVGYIITIDSIKVYAAGDTSTTKQMEQLKDYHLDYALLPTDGIYNMDVKEASQCANLIQAKHSIPIHSKPQELIDLSIVEAFTGVNRLLVPPGETIVLEKG